MATYETAFVVERPVEETFDFISSFDNAAKWDPRTFSARKVTEGPVRLGTRFVLAGSVLRKDALPVQLPAALVGALPLPYEVVGFVPPRELTLAGETPFVRYSDRIEFRSLGPHTKVHYAARLELKGPFSVGDRLLQLLFQRIGDDATRQIAAVVEAAYA